MNAVGAKEPVVRLGVERRGSVAQDAILSSNALGRRGIGLVKRHQIVETAQVTLPQVRRFVSDDVVIGRGDEHRDDSGVPGFDGQLAEVLLVARQRYAVRRVWPPCRHVRSKTQPGLNDAAAAKHAQESPRRRDLGIGQAVRHPVIVPAVVNRHHPRMQRHDVAAKLLKSLLRRPAADPNLDTGAERRTCRAESIDRPCGIGAELGARVSHEDDRRRVTSSGGQGCVVVAGHPQQIRIGLVHIADGLWIGPSEFQRRNEVEVKSKNAQRHFRDRERHRHTGHRPYELRPPGKGCRSGSHQKSV